MDFNQKAYIWENISLSQKQAAADLITMLGINKYDKVLDVGCGTGYLTEKLYELSNLTAGIDLSENMIKMANKLRPHINFKVNNAEELDLRECYDWIITNAVTYYFKDIPGTFKRFYNAIKPGGYYALQSQIKRTPEFTYRYKICSILVKHCYY